MAEHEDLTRSACALAVGRHDDDQDYILVVEDDDTLREAMAETLSLGGYKTLVASDARSALELIQSEPIGLVISDIQMDGLSGLQLLPRLKRIAPDVPFVLVTAYGSVEQAVQSIKEGAADYLVKPFAAEVLLELAERFLKPVINDDNMIAVDPMTVQVVSLAERVAASDATVMINGESGTGKEVLARYIHRHSARASAPFVAINCAAIPETMLESMLFGYEKGAFTGAYRSQAGKFEQANGGTLLLDEATEMDIGLQAKLLRVLQEREVERLGGTGPIALDVRVIATTNRNLREQVAKGAFREDLYYRLNVFPVTLPALRERPADILPLADYFLQRFGGGKALTFSPEAKAALCCASWQGNVRELENVIQRALILRVSEVIEVADLCFENSELSEAEVVGRELQVKDDESSPGPRSLEEELRDQEELLILDALRLENGNRQNAAERLQISPRTLRYKMARFRRGGEVEATAHV